ncbi:MAG TPA: hypothetical protein ENK67_02965 [Flavobacteriia bacterium]|nr:hypothetical protein [Flavobacteriia bacterium]
MKSKIVKICSLILLIPLFGFSNGNLKRQKESKTIEKEFSVKPENLLYISNRFGNVDITTWNENRIVFKITITVEGNDADMVTDKLEEINVEFDQTSNQVSAKTHIGKNKSKSWFSWVFSSNQSINYKINYTVKMPISNDLTIYNDYGSIYLNEINGKTNINCDYGKIVIGSLNNSDNEITTDYSKNSTIEYMKSGTINADYSSISVDASKNIILEADYSNSDFENIEKLEYNCDYGKLSVENANNIIGSGDYLSVELGTIFKKLDINSDYGSLRIDKLMKGFQNATINTNYTGVRVGIDKNASCNIEVDIDYGGIKYDEGFIFTKKNTKTTSKHYKGYFNQPNTNANLKIEMDFGSLKLQTK